MDRAIIHARYLDDLLKNLHQIGEDLRDIEWIMKEGMWLKYKSFEQKTLCDLIGGYHDGTGFAWELKGSTAKRAKAIEQVNSGELFLKHIGYVEVSLKIVYYSPQRYTYENV